jgi:hypothetical protein
LAPTRERWRLLLHRSRLSEAIAGLGQTASGRAERSGVGWLRGGLWIVGGVGEGTQGAVEQETELSDRAEEGDA